jgi:hypothetical protein
MPKSKNEEVEPFAPPVVAEPPEKVEAPPADVVSEDPVVVLDLYALLKERSFPNVIPTLAVTCLQKLIEAGAPVRILGGDRLEVQGALVKAGFAPNRIDALLFGEEKECREAIVRREAREKAAAEAQARSANEHPSK